MKQTKVETSFLAFLLKGEQSDPEEGCSDTQGAAELHCCFDPVESDPLAWAACLQVCDYSFQ